jgi:putative transposase
MFLLLALAINLKVMSAYRSRFCRGFSFMHNLVIRIFIQQKFTTQAFFFRNKTRTLKQLKVTNRQAVYYKTKPQWVKKEVLRLKAHLPKHGCRKIAATFNRLHEHKRHTTVSKSYCYALIKQHHYEIKIIRNKLKKQKPRNLPKNLIWATDLTTVSDQNKQQHRVFGLIDHGTRACLSLQSIHNKSSITLLRLLLNSIERYGKPNYIRTDNEHVFTSKLFRFSLWLLNIKHQRSEVCRPWQNGRIERFFGTFKQHIKQIHIASLEQLQSQLATYRFWYNHVHLHQNLNYRTPAEVWNKKTPKPNQRPIYFKEWDGILTGYYFKH